MSVTCSYSVSQGKKKCVQKLEGGGKNWVKSIINLYISLLNFRAEDSGHDT